MDPVLRGQRHTELAITSKMIHILDQDLAMLRDFTVHDYVTDANGVTHHARLETAFSDVYGDERVRRPVVRIAVENEKYETVFTRVDPANTGTSMIIRVRAGWERLKAELMTSTDGKPGSGLPLKWDTYMCTAAEQPYALEVCPCQCADSLTVTAQANKLLPCS
jgi:hypothetical protein